MHSKLIPTPTPKTTDTHTPTICRQKRNVSPLMMAQVKGLLLSTPVETVPILVSYDAVSGGIFFHAPPLVNPFASPRNPTEKAAKSYYDAAYSDFDGTDNEVNGAADKNGRGAAELGEEDEPPSEFAVHIDNAFPGRVSIATVSLRSTAPSESRVEGMESSGPLVRATLTRRDVPGVSVGRGA
ncbi:unnamed protein product, partial [Laminaria digitata]